MNDQLENQRRMYDYILTIENKTQSQIDSMQTNHREEI
jgi:hypothetical protein